jgi:rhomboid family GlyGly-CTERM serine protease
LKSYSVWIGIGVVCVLAFLAGDSATETLRFDRSAIANGEWWRTVSSHFVHLSYGHLLLNLAALALAGYVASPRTPIAFQIVAWFWLIAFTGVGLWLWAEDLNYYVGLSGALHGAMLVAIAPSPFYSVKVRWVVGLVIVSKVLWEQTGYYDDMANVEMVGGRTEARSHLYGAMAGLIWVAVWMMTRYIRNRDE